LNYDYKELNYLYGISINEAQKLIKRINSKIDIIDWIKILYYHGKWFFLINYFYKSIIDNKLK